MVPPDSYEIPGVPYYLGTQQWSARLTSTGVLPALPDLPRILRLHRAFLTPRPVNSQVKPGPTTLRMQRLSALTHTQFGLIRVRSPLLTESLLFSLPMGTEMFHFPTFPPTALYIQAEVAPHDWRHSRFPYSDIPGSQLVYQLPGAYRRLQRPSSALGAKASTDRP